MDDYFENVVSSLTIDDMNILVILYDNDATAGFKALSNGEVFERSGLSEATYRRTIYRLAANKFVEIVTVKKQNAFYVTIYGVKAIEKSICLKLEGVIA